MIDNREIDIRLQKLSADADEPCREKSDSPTGYGQSPLEATFSWAISDVLEEFGGGQAMWNDPLTIGEVEIDHGYGNGNLMASFHLYVWNQVKVGKYTADFLIAYRPGRYREIRYLVIECDGHDFHERTKQQAEHDRRRDREMLPAGIPVLRVTGSEVWRSPIRAAFDVLIAAKKVLGAHA